MARPPILVSDDAARRPAPRRGLSCAEAADYIGVSVTKFLELVSDGRMPKAVEIDRRRIWDIRRLDQAFDLLTDDEDFLPATDSMPLQPRRKIVL